MSVWFAFICKWLCISILSFLPFFAIFPVIPLFRSRRCRSEGVKWTGNVIFVYKIVPLCISCCCSMIWRRHSCGGINLNINRIWVITWGSNVQWLFPSIVKFYYFCLRLYSLLVCKLVCYKSFICQLVMFQNVFYFCFAVYYLSGLMSGLAWPLAFWWYLTIIVMSVVCFCLNICLCYVYSSYNQVYTSVLLQGCNVGFQQNLSHVFNIHL